MSQQIHIRILLSPKSNWSITFESTTSQILNSKPKQSTKKGSQEAKKKEETHARCTQSYQLDNWDLINSKHHTLESKTHHQF